MTYRELAEITRDYPRRVAPSTFCGALIRGTLPARDLVASFLRALDLSEETQAIWLDVWQHLKDGRPVRPSALRRWRALPNTTSTSPPSPASTDTATAADRPPLRPTPQPTAYPVFAVRDWILVDGHWHATGKPGAYTARRRIKAQLARLDLRGRFGTLG